MKNIATFVYFYYNVIYSSFGYYELSILFKNYCLVVSYIEIKTYVYCNVIRIEFSCDNKPSTVTFLSIHFVNYSCLVYPEISIS